MSDSPNSVDSENATKEDVAKQTKAAAKPAPTPAKEPEAKAPTLDEVARILEKLEAKYQLQHALGKEEVRALRRHCYGTDKQIAERMAARAKAKAEAKLKLAKAEEAAAKAREEALNS